MKILRFRNTDGTIDVSYKTDLITENQSNFTVMSIEGLDAVEKGKGMDFQQLPTNINAFKTFAIDNELELTSLALGRPNNVPVVIVELPEEEEEEEDPTP